MTRMSDERLAARAGAGDLDAFEQLLRRYHLRIYRLGLGIVGDSRDAEEAAQDTFFTAWRSLSRFRGDAKVSTWLYRIATNRCLKHLRRQVPPSAELVERTSRWGNPEAELEADESLRAVASGIAALSDDQRTVIVLREVQGLAYDEIAAVLGVSVTSVKSRLNRARVELARRLTPTEDHL